MRRIPGTIGITVKPNPAEEGGSVTVTGEPGEIVYVSAGKGNSVEVKLDANGQATIKVPVKANDEFTVSDGKLPKSTDIVVCVVSSLTQTTRK